MKRDRRARLIIWGSVLLVAIAIVVPSVTLAIRHRGPVATLQDPNPAVRIAALRAAGNEGHVDLLIQGLQDEDADVRLISAMYLKRPENATAPIIEALIAALRDKHAGVRREAAESLSYIGAPAAPALVTALADSDPRVRIGAILGLSDRPKDIRKRSPEERALVIPAMEKLLKDEDLKVRGRAERFLRFVRDE